jgi:hypothetical protein
MRFKTDYALDGQLWGRQLHLMHRPALARLVNLLQYWNTVGTVGFVP